MIIIVQLRKFLEVWKLMNKFEFSERRSVTPFSLIMSKKKGVSADSVWWKHLNVILQGWGRWDVQLVPENYAHDSWDLTDFCKWVSLVYHQPLFKIFLFQAESWRYIYWERNPHNYPFSTSSKELLSWTTASGRWRHARNSLGFGYI